MKKRDSIPPNPSSLVGSAVGCEQPQRLACSHRKKPSSTYRALVAVCSLVVLSTDREMRVASVFGVSIDFVFVALRMYYGRGFIFLGP